MKTVQPEFNHARRALFARSGTIAAGGVALAAISALPAAPDADAELIALCAKAEAHWRRFHDFYPGGATAIADDEEREIALKPLYGAEDQIGEEISNMRATTLAGHRARARAVLAYYGDFDCFETEVGGIGVDGVVLAALVRDLVGEDAL